jgi:xylitol oxidase
MKNWAGNLRYTSQDVRSPRSLDELREIVGASQRIKALGTRHAFSDAADTTGTLLRLDSLPTEIDIDQSSRTVRVSAGTTYATLGAILHARGWALHNLASLPHISVAGAVQTGTHGSGIRNGSLASRVVAFDIVRAHGDIETLRADDADFDASVVGLGALGVVTSLTLRIEPTFDVAQQVHEALPWTAALDNWAALMGSGYSVSVFTTFRGENTHQVWTKRRESDDAPTLDLVALGGTPAERTVHPLPAVSAESVTTQRGIPGPWHERLPHFRPDFQPSHGDEIQSEYLIPFEHSRAALTALRELSPLIAPLLFVSELRAVGADAAWLSPSSERDSLAIHFTWQQRGAEVLAVLPRIEAALAPFGPRPHWGKVSTMPHSQLREVYPRLDDFAALTRRVDPENVFGNAFLERVLFGR